jgi:carbon starvation protein
VWVLLQPRDYINGLQLFVGLGLLYVAVLIAVVARRGGAGLQRERARGHAQPGAPAVRHHRLRRDLGFHGLVASGTTSKQLDKETDARFVGYFGSVGEGMLALAAIICTTAGFATLVDWEAVYTSSAPAA